MPFIRIKKIKNKEYAYLVENTWKKRKKASRQKTLKYLGRVHKLEKNNITEFNIEEGMSFDQILNHCVKVELLNHGFSEEEGKFVLDNHVVNTQTKQVYKKTNGKDISLQMNEGFLNSYSLYHLLNYKPKGDINKIGYDLANVFVSAGINLHQEEFISVFSKLLELHDIKNPVLEQMQEQAKDFDADNFYY